MVELVYGRLSESTYRDAISKLPKPNLKLAP
jgi:hypothetical protein